MAEHLCEIPKETCHPELDEMYYDHYDTYLDREYARLGELHDSLWTHRKINPTACLCEFVKQCKSKTEGIKKIEKKLVERMKPI